MNVERTRAFLHTLPHVVETVQFGDNLVFWVGDKAIGGRMFVLVDLDGSRSAHPVISFHAGATAFSELVEIEGLIPAPYLARAHWVAAITWTVFRNAEWQDHLRRAHTLTVEKLARATRRILALPPGEGAQRITAAREKAAAKVPPQARAKRRTPHKPQSS